MGRVETIGNVVLADTLSASGPARTSSYMVFLALPTNVPPNALDEALAVLLAAGKHKAAALEKTKKPPAKPKSP